MFKRAILVGLCLAASFPAAAQVAHHPAPPAHLITPPAPLDSDLPFPPVTQSSAAVDTALPSPADTVVAPAPEDKRGTEQAPLAVKIIPAPTSAAETAQAAQDRQDRAALHLWMIVLTGAVAGLALFQLLVLLTTLITARRQLRAYVFVSRAEIVGLEVGAVPIVELDIKNTGQTPAYNLTHVWRCGLFSHPLTERLPLPAQGETLAIAHLGPGATVKVHRTAERQLIHGRVELSNRPRAFYVYGEISYKDAYQQRRFTRYVFFHEGPPRLGPGQLVAHQRGNDAS